MQAEYAGKGIEVLVMSNYYAHNPAGTGARCTNRILANSALSMKRQPLEPNSR